MLHRPVLPLRYPHLQRRIAFRDFVGPPFPIDMTDGVGEMDRNLLLEKDLADKDDTAIAACKTCMLRVGRCYSDRALIPESIRS
jgi:hypothetical protein